jgi:DMSO/TMAO reductase YedYZ molybdopterin-dependent catalytic subunit
VLRRSFLEALLRAWPGFVLANLPAAGLAQRAIPKDRLIVRSPRPEDLETPVHLLTSWITPNELFYVRSHFYTPSVDVGAWRLRVDGEVATPLDLTLDDVRRLNSSTQVITLECAGNGRAFFDPPVAGVQWERGAVGTAAWTGVRLAELLERAGARSSARYVWFDGADRGVGKAPDFVRSLPIAKALDYDTLLAYEMNGETLPVVHGFPLRVIVPGWEGAYSVKWVTHIRVSSSEHDGPFVQSGYRYPRRPVAPGSIVPPQDMLPLKDLPVKSLITSPAANAVVPRGAPVQVSGFAWAGEAAIRRVDVSTDNGRTWARAQLGRDRSRYAWRQFEYRWRPPDGGSYLLLSRATDSRGLTQPVTPEWNPAGYVWNAIDSVRVNVEV